MQTLLESIELDKLADNLLTEVQLVPLSAFEAKDKSHSSYEMQRIEPIYKKCSSIGVIPNCTCHSNMN